jgi:hypothetical protein
VAQSNVSLYELVCDNCEIFTPSVIKIRYLHTYGLLSFQVVIHLAFDSTLFSVMMLCFSTLNIELSLPQRLKK